LSETKANRGDSCNRRDETRRLQVRLVQDRNKHISRVQDRKWCELVPTFQISSAIGAATSGRVRTNTIRSTENLYFTGKISSSFLRLASPTTPIFKLAQFWPGRYWAGAMAYDQPKTQ